MDDNRFFKFIWRINAIAIAAILIFTMAMLFSELVYNKMFRNRSTAEVVNIDTTDTSIIETRKVTINERIAGYDLFRVSLNSEQEYDYGYSSKSTRQSMLNTGFYDPTTGVTNWLFQSQDQLITNYKTIYLKQIHSETESNVALGHLVTFVDKDTSDDKRLSNSDDKKVMALRPGELDGKIILSDIESDPSISQLGADTFILFFTNATGQHSTIYNVKTLSIGAIHNISLP